MKKLITTLGMIASANVFAYNMTLDNQSNLDIVVKANGSPVCTITKKTMSSCDLRADLNTGHFLIDL